MKKSVRVYEKKNGSLVAETRYTADRYYSSDINRDYEAGDARYYADEQDTPVVGEKYMVATREYVGPNGDKNPDIRWEMDNGDGWSGNSDRNIKRYHGWRGTTGDWALYGMGVRECVNVKKSGKRSWLVRIEFGPDLKLDQK